MGKRTLFVQSPNGHSSKGWGMSKPGVSDSVWVSHMARRPNTWAIFHFFHRHVSRDLDWKRINLVQRLSFLLGAFTCSVMETVRLLLYSESRVKIGTERTMIAP